MESKRKELSLNAVWNQIDTDDVIQNKEVNEITSNYKRHESLDDDSQEIKINIFDDIHNLPKDQVENIPKSKSDTKDNIQNERQQSLTGSNRKGNKSIQNSNPKNGFENESAFPFYQRNRAAKNTSIQQKKEKTKEPNLQRENNAVKERNKISNPNSGKNKFSRKNDIREQLPKRELFPQREVCTVKQKNKISISKLGTNNPLTRNVLIPRKDDSIQHSKRKIAPMPFHKLKNLTTKGSNEVLLTILDDESGFSLFFDQQIKRDLMAYVLLALGKAIESSMNNNMTAMILNITRNSNFFLVNLQQYLASFQMCKSDECHLESLLSLSEFLHKFQISLPSNAADVLLILLPLLKLTCEKYLSSNEKLYSVVSLKLEQIEEQNSQVLEKYSANEIKQISHKEKLQLMNPPECYRSIPVLPNSDDVLQGCSFLRPNLVKGKYQDVEHYLDVQYRLLREDYVKPLRDGIAEYLKLKKQGKPVKQCKDVRVYLNVHIVKQEFVNGGLVHMAHFNEKNFSKIKWDFSKRFLTGSLLCLTQDDFKTMLFASIARREPKELNKGLLLLRFEELTDEILNLSPLMNFTVVETSAYFEAYRYNLNALQQLNETTLPMKQYIVETQKNVQKPLYLSENTTYDLRPLLLPLNCDNIEIEINELRSSISERAKSINILNTHTWPTSKELNLNPSQFTALKAAVTKEFAVIQGPPGTGKTFVGLRIAQLLLYNINKWQSDANQLPILVICHTNHALDQFLEGLLLFTKKLVRIGGRSNNDAIYRYQLNNLKKVISARREVPHYIFSNLKKKHFEFTKLKKDIDKIQLSAQKSFNSVLSENVLKEYISPEHYISLKSMRKYLKDDGFMLNDWLGIRFRDSYSKNDTLKFPHESVLNNFQTNELPSTINIPLEFEDYSEAEDDIDYIEAQRDIISDEFNDVSYDMPTFVNEDNWVPISQDGWEIQGGERQLKQYIKHSLENNPAMLEEDTKKIKNIWMLPLQHRWCLYKYWLECYIQAKTKEGFELQEQLRKEYEKLCEMRTEEDIYVCQRAHVVGMTTTGAAKYRHIVQRLNPKVLIVEEAAEILESHIVTSLAPGTQHVILIGDHQQLRPSPTVHLLAVKYDLNISLFERMIGNGMDCHKLTIQHRMRPEIAALISPHIYNDLSNHESVLEYENIKGVGKNLFFISHSYNELQEYDSKSKVNQHEAKFMIKLCKYFTLQGYTSSQITVLTTYSGQLFEMKRLCSQSVLKDVKFTVVDNYQGEENDIILISFVRSNVEGEIGFLKVSNRVCVALSRAKKGLFCIGNFKLLAEKSDLWKNIMDQLEKDSAVGPSLQLMCQNHPGVSNIVATEKDFDSVPEGGCTRKCDFRLKCGHVCQMMCHPYDVEHEKVQCQKPCNERCSEGHLCQRKCYQNCGQCEVMVPKLIENCGHTIEVFCYQKNTEDTLCTLLCDKYLSCGHMCPRLCSTPCPLKCFEKINVQSKVCGHKVIIECFDYENEELLAKNCKEPCRVELSCGHMCKGTCSKCYQGRLHTACNQPCKRILVCGHECKSPCSKSCPPCEYPCENQCTHSKCPKKCGEPCEKCTEPCDWSCPHKSCSSLCGELCDRTACNEPCPMLLECKHPCIGLCGEPCPIECRICNEEVKEIFFGSEDELDARFITLEDCKHIFELNGVTQWMQYDNQEKREIQMKTCPKCKKVIRKSLRFGNIVKCCLAEIEKVKRIMYGNAEQNIQSQHAMLQRLKKAGKTWKLSLVCKPLIEVLSSGKTRSIQAITTMENIINILMLLHETQSSMVETLMPISTDNTIQIAVTKLKTYMRKTENWLTYFIKKAFLTASEQQLQELSWEVHRLKLAGKLLIFIQKGTKIEPNMCLDTLLQHIMTYMPFREEETKKFTTEFEKFVELAGGSKINISDLEKKSILKAMGLSKGHWYQCPNGHVYCITECGGAMVESKCNECREDIGGTHHTLLSSNRVATAMDGAQHSAWSDAMNMENYRF